MWITDYLEMKTSPVSNILSSGAASTGPQQQPPVQPPPQAEAPEATQAQSQGEDKKSSSSNNDVWEDSLMWVALGGAILVSLLVLKRMFK